MTPGKHTIVLYAPEDYTGAIAACTTCDKQLCEWYSEEVPLDEVNAAAYEHSKEDFHAEIAVLARSLLREFSVKDILHLLAKFKRS